MSARWRGLDLRATPGDGRFRRGTAGAESFLTVYDEFGDPVAQAQDFRELTIR